MALSESKNIPELMITKDSDLDITHADYDVLDPHWEKINDCYVGGGNIYDAIDGKYLIKKSNETSTDYDDRKKRSVYYNKCAQIISTYQGHLWRKEPTRDLASPLKKLMENVDKEDTTANEFFRFITEWAQIFGVYFVLIEYPENYYRDDQTIAEEQELGLRPYMVPIDPRNILDWGYSIDPNGSKSLEYVVIKEVAILYNIPFQPAQTENRYRVIFKDHHEIYRYDEDHNIELLYEKDNTLGEIPLVPFYAKKVKDMVGKSVLTDIVDLNIELYNKHSDKDTAEWWTAHPVPFFKGFQASDVETGPQYGVFNMNPNSDIRLVEFSGTSIGALRETEQDILREIFDLALKQVKPTSVQRQTIESKRFDRLDALSDLQARAISFSESETECWKYMAKWINIDYKNISVDYNLDYNITELQSDMIKTLLTLSQSKIITKETLLKLLLRGEILLDDFDIDKEMKALEESKEETKEKLNEDGIPPEDNDALENNDE